MCETPIAVIDLLDADRAWVKAGVGFPFEELARERSFSATVVEAGRLVTVRDAELDERFSDARFVVGEPRARFLAGAPLVSPGVSSSARLP